MDSRNTDKIMAIYYIFIGKISVAFWEQDTILTNSMCLILGQVLHLSSNWAETTNVERAVDLLPVCSLAFGKTVSFQELAIAWGPDSALAG